MPNLNINWRKYPDLIPVSVFAEEIHGCSVQAVYDNAERLGLIWTAVGWRVPKEVAKKYFEQCDEDTAIKLSEIKKKRKRKAKV